MVKNLQFKNKIGFFLYLASLGYYGDYSLIFFVLASFHTGEIDEDTLNIFYSICIVISSSEILKMVFHTILALWSIMHVSEFLNVKQIIANKMQLIDIKQRLEISIAIFSPLFCILGWCGPLLPFLLYQFSRIKFAASIIYKANIVWFSEKGLPVHKLFSGEPQ